MKYAPRTVAVGALQYGDHTSLVYGSEAEHDEALEVFLRSASGHHDEVVYAAPAERANQLRERFGDFPNVRIEDTAQTYLAGGRFDPQRMMAHYARAARDAVSKGYAGFRVAAEMSWASGYADITQLAAYERSLDAALASHPAIALCAYDRRLFDKTSLARVIHAHTSTAVSDPLTRSARLEIRRTPDRQGIVVRGELDISARDHLGSALSALAAERPESPVIDLRAVRYVDAASVAMIAHAFADIATPRVLAQGQVASVFRTLARTLPCLEIEECA